MQAMLRSKQVNLNSQAKQWNKRIRHIKMQTNADYIYLLKTKFLILKGMSAWNIKSIFSLMLKVVKNKSNISLLNLNELTIFNFFSNFKKPRNGFPVSYEMFKKKKKFETMKVFF